MANIKSRLSKNELGKIFYKLCLAVSRTKKPEKAADFLRDLLSYQEAEMIAKRLKIAEMLLSEMGYEGIRKKIKVSHGTIARVQEWLKISGDGYRWAIEETKNKNIEIKKECPVMEINAIKKRYPMYYWPEIVLEEIIKTANKKQADKLKNILDQMSKMKSKTRLYKQLKKLVKY